MPLIRKRRAHAESDQASDYSEQPGPSPAPVPHRRRRIQDDSPESNDDDDDDDDDDEVPKTQIQAPSSTDVMIKKLVRLALASEYSRQAIRRTDISAKVLGEHGARQFKTVFEGAQKALRARFGMELVELPAKEKVTIRERRAAQKVERPSLSNKAWILTSTLPAAYRTSSILTPTKAPSSALESTYTGLYTFIISVIMLNGGTLPEAKLERYLRRANAETYTPVDRTDRLLQRLCKEGYLVRNREMDGGEEVIEYMVGPRGKVEVGVNGVAGLVREVYGRPAPDGVEAAREDGDDLTAAEGEEMELFERRLRRSLGINERVRPGDGGEVDNGEGARRRGNARSGRDEEEEEEEDNDDDD